MIYAPSLALPYHYREISRPRDGDFALRPRSVGAGCAGSDGRKAAQIVKERGARWPGARWGRDTSPMAHDSVVSEGEAVGQEKSAGGKN